MPNPFACTLRQVNMFKPINVDCLARAVRETRAEDSLIAPATQVQK